MKKIIFTLCLAIALVSCMEDKVYEGPPQISDISVEGGLKPEETAKVSAKITAIDGVKTAMLYYKVDKGEYTNLTMAQTQNTFTATIPAQADGVTVTYYIEARANNGKVAKSDEMSYTVGADPIKYEDLVLNEINGNDKFMEIFNKGETDIPMEGVYIEKDDKQVWTGIAERVLKAGEYLVLYTDRNKGDMPQWPEDLFFEGGLSAGKAVRVQLFSPTKTSLDDFNLVNYTTPAPASYSRFPNASGPWVYAEATPGAENTTGGDKVTGLE